MCKAVIGAIDGELTVEDRKDNLAVEKKMQKWCDAAKGQDKKMVSTARARLTSCGLRAWERGGGLRTRASAALWPRQARGRLSSETWASRHNRSS